MTKRILDTLTAAGRLAVLGAAIAVAAAPAAAVQDAGQEPAVQEPAVAAPAVTKASYNERRGALVIVGTGFDDTAVIRINGVEVQGQRKYRADKQKLRIKVDAATLALKAAGQNTVEVVQGGASSGEIAF